MQRANGNYKDHLVGQLTRHWAEWKSQITVARCISSGASSLQELLSELSIMSLVVLS